MAAKKKDTKKAPTPKKPVAPKAKPKATKYEVTTDAKGNITKIVAKKK